MSTEEEFNKLNNDSLAAISDIKISLAKIQSIKLPMAQVPNVLLPTPESFKKFYQGMNYTKMHPQVSVHGNIIQLKTSYDLIELSTEAIVELLADKLKQPVIAPSVLKIKSPPPFTGDIDQVLNEKLYWLNAEFKKLLAYKDPLIAKLCQDTYEARAYLLLVRIKYSEWKESNLDYIVRTAEDSVELKKNAEIRGIKDDYDKKYKTEQGRLNTEIEKYKKEYLKFKNIADNQAQTIANTINDAENAKGLIEDLHEKLRDIEKKAGDAEYKWIQAQKKLEDSQKKLEKYEKNQWAQSPTKAQYPAYKNEATKEIFTFPCTIDEFKNSYQLTKSEDGFDIFEANGKKPERVPEGLTKLLNQSQDQPTKTSEGGKTKTKISGVTAKVLKAIQDSDEPINMKEIEAISGVDYDNISRRHIKPLLEEGDIGEEIGADGTKRYYPI